MEIDWTQIIITLIQLLLVPAILWGIKAGVTFLQTRALAVQNTETRERLQYYLNMAAAAIETAVIETQQTFVDSIKGTEGWDKATMSAAFARSMERAKAIMGTAVYDGLTEAVGDVNEWITAQIEASVRGTKVTVLTPLPCGQDVQIDGGAAQ